MSTQMKVAIDLIQKERLRQTSEEGYGESHDDDHADGELAIAAACYAVSGARVRGPRGGLVQVIATEGEFRTVHGERWPAGLDAWPWGDHDKRPRTPRLRALVKAGALIVAELERLMRSAGK